jgi:hypothetical protein
LDLGGLGHCPTGQEAWILRVILDSSLSLTPLVCFPVNFLEVYLCTISPSVHVCPKSLLQLYSGFYWVWWPILTVSDPLSILLREGPLRNTNMIMSLSFFESFSNTPWTTEYNLNLIKAFHNLAPSFSPGSSLISPGLISIASFEVLKTSQVLPAYLPLHMLCSLPGMFLLHLFHQVSSYSALNACLPSAFCDVFLDIHNVLLSLTLSSLETSEQTWIILL